MLEVNVTDLYEIDIMRKIAQMLNELEPGQQARVVRWICDKYGNHDRLSPSTRKESVDSAADSEDLRAKKQIKKTQYPQNFPDYYQLVHPETDAERALISAYWLQIIQGKESVRALDVNNLLKELGHQVNNITRAFDHLQTKSPQLIIQVRKKGKSQQSRKRYRVTAAGRQFIEEQL